MSYPPAPPPGYGQPGGYPPAPQQQGSNGVAIAALVTGILSMVCLPPLGFVAVVLAIMGLSKAKSMNGNGKGLAIGGLVTGIIGILATIVIALVLIFAEDTTDDINSDPSDGVCNEERFIQDPDC
jgi:formate hydrogenlyase subunit 3/multisubunit Na+/H+ antiporter MnhD subunit